MPTLSAKSYESLAMDPTVVPYAPPLARFSPEPEPFQFWWKGLYYTFGLESPYDFEPMSPFSSTEALEHYCDAARELASSVALVYGSEVSVRVRRGDDGTITELITPRFPPAELVRGWLVLFRQFYSTKELASFQKCHGAIISVAKNATDPAGPHRLEVLKSWKKAEGRLKAYNLKYLIGEKLIEQGRFAPPIPDAGSPAQLISMFAYGDLIHWGDKREELSRRQADAFGGPTDMLRFVEAVAGLAYLYMGFALIVARCVGRGDEFA
jgi:hypothetical protein